MTPWSDTWFLTQLKILILFFFSLIPLTFKDSISNIIFDPINSGLPYMLIYQMVYTEQHMNIMSEDDTM